MEVARKIQLGDHSVKIRYTEEDRFPYAHACQIVSTNNWDEYVTFDVREDGPKQLELSYRRFLAKYRHD